MKRKNATRSALFTSIISLLLCVSMLVGTTFAWFTDSVVSGNNVIAAGNLDIELEYYDGSSWKTVNGATELFTGNLWEPGHTEVVYLKLSNLGTLALKYHLGINIASETEGTNVAGETFKLSDHIYMGVVENAEPTYTSREAAITAAKGGANGIIGAGYTKSGSMTADAADLHLAVVVYMPETVGNEANYMTGTARPEINLGINLFATQLENESDSFGPDYDKGAAWAGEVGEVPAEVDGVITINSAGELAAFAADVNNGNNYEGKTVKLGANIDLNDIAWTPIGNSSNKFNGTFIGTGYTISNLYVTGTKGVGLFGYTWTSAHIEGVTIDGAVVSGNDYVGAILGSGYLSANCIKDCTVNNAAITATPYLMADGVTYDGGAKAGVIAGQAYNGNIIGCTVTNSSVTAYRDLGSVAGMLYADGVTGRTLTASGNTAEDVTLAYVDLNGAAYESNKVNENMGDVVGRLGRSSEKCNMPVVENNTVTDVTRDAVIMWTDDGVVYEKDVDTGVVTMYDITDAAPADLTIPEGVTEIGGWAFSGNTSVKTVTMPSTLTRIVRKAFDGSAVEKVVLNEGLTEIEQEAFSKATNLKEINFPSTLTTVGYQAFRLTAFESLTIPATLTNLGEGSFRDLSNLTSVTIEGDAVIANYAFRTCALLENVYILGENTTFTGTSQVFTNNDSTNSGVVNVYVPNETVKQRLLDATGNDKSLNITVCNVVDDSNIASSLSTPNSTVLLPAGTYTDFPSIAEGVTIVGQDGVVFNDTLSGTLNNVTIKNVEISAGNAQRWAYAKGTLLFEDCTFEATSVYAIHYDGLTNANVTYKNCKIVGWVAIGGGAEHITFDGCEIYGNGAYGLIRLYSPGTIKNCTFDVSAVNTTDVYQDGIHAVDCEIKVENSTNVNGDVTALFNISGTGGIKMDGRSYVANATQLKNAVAAGATDIYLLDGEYNIEGCAGKTLTLTGSKNAVLKVMNEGEDGCDYGFDGATVTFNGLTINTTANGGNYKGYARMTATFNDCSFFGAYTSHRVQTFNRCDFDFNNGYFWIWGAEKVTFDGCQFGGNSKAILAHGGASTVITINNCDFSATEKGYTGSGDNTAAIEIDPTGSNTYTINFTGENTITDSYAGWTRVKDGSTGHVVNGLN